MKLTYPAIFHKGDTAYWVEFPDLDGCFSQGDTKNEVLANAAESLEGYTLNLIEKGRSLPAASDLMNIPVDKNSYTSYVSVDLTPYLRTSKAVKKTLTLPSWLNQRAEQAGVNFSAVLQEALMKKLDIVPE